MTLSCISFRLQWKFHFWIWENRYIYALGSSPFTQMFWYDVMTPHALYMTAKWVYLEAREMRCLWCDSEEQQHLASSVSWATDSVGLGCVTLAPHFNFQLSDTLKSYFWSWWWYTPPGCRPNASEPILYYKASINNPTRTSSIWLLQFWRIEVSNPGFIHGKNTSRQVQWSSSLH